LGFINIQPDQDGVFRRIPLIVRFGSSFYPSFFFRAVCDYLNVKPADIIVKPGKWIRLKNARSVKNNKHHDIVIPVDRQCCMVVNFVGSWERMQHFNYSDIYFATEDSLEFDLYKQELAGKIVIISDVSSRSTDVGPVPTDTHFPLSGLHANALHNVLTESFLKEMPGIQMLMLEVSLLLIVLVISIRFSSLPSSFGVLFLLGFYFFGASILFIYFNLIVNLSRPLTMIGLALISVVIYRYFQEEKQKAILQKTFEAYFPPAVVKKILANPGMLVTGGQKKQLTIMFSDIVGFTSYSTGVPPDQIQNRLNQYFESMTDIIFKYKGTVDKFIGDGMMVFFGDPEPQPDHALQCVRAALEMRTKVDELSAAWVRKGDAPLDIRIGINTGEVVVGNMGSSRRMSYTALGLAVNLAQRLEANAPINGILISEQTYDLVKEQVVTRARETIRVKGFDHDIPVFELIS